MVTIDQLKEQRLKDQKETQKRLITAAKAEVESVEQVGDFIIHLFKTDLEGDAKALNEAATVLKKKFKNVPFILLSFSEGSLFVKSEFPTAAKGAEKNAKQWVAQVLSLAGSDKFGGAEKAAQGQAATGVDQVVLEKCLDAAKSFVLN